MKIPISARGLLQHTGFALVVLGLTFEINAVGFASGQEKPKSERLPADRKRRIQAKLCRMESRSATLGCCCKFLPCAGMFYAFASLPQGSCRKTRPGRFRRRSATNVLKLLPMPLPIAFAFTPKHLISSPLLHLF